MDTVKKFISNNFKVIGFGLCAVGVSAVAVNKLWPVKKKERYDSNGIHLYKVRCINFTGMVNKYVGIIID